jgi:hypothetical protein
MKCVCNDTGQDWADVCNWVAAAYRASHQESTGQTPNQMVFGKNNNMPLDIMYGVPDPEPPCTTTYVEWLHANLAYMHKEARVHLGPKLRAQKKYFDARLKQRKFEVGDLVL